MSNSLERSPPASPPTLLENTQPMESAHVSNISATASSQKQLPTVEEFLSDCNESDAMIIDGKEKRIYDNNYQNIFF